MKASLSPEKEERLEASARFKRTQEESERKAAFLEALVNTSTLGVLVVDQESKTIFQNQHFVDLFKMPRNMADEGSHETRLRWFAGTVKKPEQFMQKIRHLYAHPDETTHDEIELKDGTVLDRYSSPVVGKDGNYFGRVWTFRDITAHKQAEEALCLGEERFHAMFDLASVGFAEVDPQTACWLKVNRKMVEITGYSADELVRMSVVDIIHPGDKQAFQEAFRHVTQGEAPGYHAERRYIRKDGALVWVNINMTLIHDAVGQPKWYMAVIEDISARKNAEEELRASKKKLQDLFEFSHDAIMISDPLTGRFSTGNPAAVKLFGAKSEEDFISRSL
jgi:PAS domain S-box-containing protein